MSPNARDDELSYLLWLDADEPVAAASPARTSDSSGWPGEAGLWVFLFGDMTLFGAFFVAFLAYDRRDRAGFAAGADSLLRSAGAANTLVLLTSSLFVVLAVRALSDDHGQRAARWLTCALGCAVMFAGLKAVEWTREISAGHTPASGRFFLFYFVLTGVHLLHVVVGSALLEWTRRRAATPDAWTSSRVGIEVAAVYWHMVDLLWVIIFTLLYVVASR